MTIIPPLNLRISVMLVHAQMRGRWIVASMKRRAAPTKRALLYRADHYVTEDRLFYWFKTVLSLPLMILRLLVWMQVYHR
jgi:hypothetical protein